MVVICGMLLAVILPIGGEQAREAPEAITVGGVRIAGVPDDWTHHHLIFSDPGTEEDAIANGTHDRWLKIVNDPRYVIQQLKRRARAEGPGAADVARIEAGRRAYGMTATRGPMRWHPLREAWPKLSKDRSTSFRWLQAAILVLGLSVTMALLIRRRWTPTLLTVVSTAALLLLISCGTGSSNSNMTPSGQTIDTDWTMDLGTPSVGANQFPAKYSFSTTGTAQCSGATTPDYVVYNTGVAGFSGTQANIIAYDNIYSGCSGTVPTVYWSYYSGTGTAETSPVLSGDGTKVAFIETPSSGAAILRILKWVGAQGTDYDHPNAPQHSYTNTTAGAGTNTAWSTCPSGQSCMISISFQNGDQDEISAPFYDYAHDIAYVGDASGKLHKFTGVFTGTPGEVTSSPWPISVSTHVLTSPVYDSGTSNAIFVGDSGGFLYSYNATTGAAGMTSSQLAASGGIVDGPLVDSSTEFVYVFVGDDENTSTAVGCENDTGCNGVFQFAAGNSTTGTGACTSNNTGTAWSGAGRNCGTESIFGIGLDNTVIYDGSFDQVYFSGAGTSGNLWTCASNGSSGSPVPKLMNTAMSAFVPSGDVIGIANNAINPLATASGTCSPVTEVFGSAGTTDDYIFLGVTNNGNQAVCAGACLYNFEVSTNGTSTTVPTKATAGLASPGGTSGISIDNTLTSTGASQIYFSTLANQSCGGNSNGSAGAGTGGCAVQALQTNP
jgi:hypothetical protein